MGKHHVPTNRIMIEDVLAFAVDHGAEPRDRQLWDEINEANRAKFARGASWGIGPA